MSKKPIDVELVEAIENFVDAKIAVDWATRQKPFSQGLFEAAEKLAVQKKDEMRTKILHLTWIASAR